MRWDIYNTREWWLAVALNCTTRDRWWWWWYADVEGSQVPHTATAKSHSGIQINRMKKKKNKNHTQKILQNINNFYTSFSRRRSLSNSPHLLYYLFDTNIYAIRRWARAVCIFFCRRCRSLAFRVPSSILLEFWHTLFGLVDGLVLFGRRDQKQQQQLWPIVVWYVSISS